MIFLPALELLLYRFAYELDSVNPPPLVIDNSDHLLVEAIGEGDSHLLVASNGPALSRHEVGSGVPINSKYQSRHVYPLRDI